MSDEDPKSLFDWAESLPEARTTEEMAKHLGYLFKAILLSTVRDRPQVEKALVVMKVRQPLFARALIESYATTDVTFDIQFLVLQLLGELQTPEVLPFFSAEVWKPFPPEPAEKTDCTSQSEREFAEMLRGKAVHGIGYLRTNEAFSELERIVTQHESAALRIDAINTYMWNQKDSSEAADYLYGILPPEFHPYVERPRFHRGMDSRTFSLRMAQWQKRWATKRGFPINPAHSAPKPTEC